MQDWTPAAANETALESSKTRKTMLSPISLESLVAWPNITALKYASGTGYYDTIVTLDEPEKNVRTLMSLGQVGGTAGLVVNGRTIDGLDFFGNQPIDITSHVRAGQNGETARSMLPSTFC